MADEQPVATPSNDPAAEVTEPSEAPASLRERLVDLTARATALNAVKKYEDAAELYAEAAEVQAEINGEMAVENADILFAYGKCLFFVAQKTSTVLGGTAAGAQLKNSKSGSARGEGREKKRRKIEKETNGAGPSSSLQPVTETSEPADVVPEEVVEDNATASDKPLFQISGDGDWADSSDEEEAEAEEEEEEEDDFNTAFEVLDLARVLYLRKLDSQETTTPDNDKGKSVASEESTPAVKEIKTRVADIYDLQAEISLEGEKFDAAVTDLRSCLALKEELNPPESSLLAECHYKLSLALEAACQIQQRDKDGNPVGDISIDWDLRNEAVVQQERAIESCKLRVSKETKEIEAMTDGKDKDKAQANVDDVQDMVSAMELRLVELRKPPISVTEEAKKDMAKEMAGSILGEVFSAGSKEQQDAKLAEAVAGANDLSGMVKRKKPKTEAASTTSVTVNENGKRKVAFVDDGDGKTNGKKAKVEDAPEES